LNTACTIPDIRLKGATTSYFWSFQIGDASRQDQKPDQVIDIQMHIKQYNNLLIRHTIQSMQYNYYKEIES